MKLELENIFVRGAIAGSISAAVICMFMEIFELLGLAKKCWLFMAGQPVMQFTHTLWQSVFAFLVHLGVGAFWGVIIALLFSFVFTTRYYLFKGPVMGISIFFLHVGLLSKVLGYPLQLREDLVSLFLIFLTYIIYGGLAATLIVKLPWKEPVS
ncbi:MAG TPA: hypothetical protein VHY08_15990 [Bacillota bacterium]|nr:hypothetical protein [Bacillota bacterium]